ncbi:uncharacterized, partial [Tachysurus ichikawai]
REKNGFEDTWRSFTKNISICVINVDNHIKAGHYCKQEILHTCLMVHN